jgi:hypothetical protein
MSKNVVLNGSKVSLTHNYPFRIGLISDLHVGAQHGIFPVDFADKLEGFGAGNKLNNGQLKLWEYFNDFIGKLNSFKTNTLVVNGDLIAGKNFIEGGTYMMNVDLEYQKKAAAQLLAYVCKQCLSIEQVFVLKGTPYHGARDTSVESHIVDKLQILCPNINASYQGEYMFMDLKYNGKKKSIWMAHPTSGGVIYPETAYGRDIGQFLQAQATGKLPKIDMIIRAHKHEYVELHKSSIRYMVLPCWEFFCPYDGAVKMFSKWQPDIGGAILLADEELRLRPMHFTYDNITDPEKYLTLQHISDPYKVVKKCLSKK